MRKILDFDDQVFGPTFRGLNGIVQVSAFFRIDPAVEMTLQISAPGTGPEQNPKINDVESADHDELQRAGRDWADTDVVVKDSCIITFYMNKDSLYRFKSNVFLTPCNAVAYITELGI